jgi:phosphatidylglycerophosphate synthase
MRPRHLVNAISLSRILLALAFVLLFQENATLLPIAGVIVVAVLFTDLIDGFLARRLGVATVHGRLWDSLGDKTFYTAVIVAFSTQRLLSPVLAWGLIAREVASYVTRIVYAEKLPMIERIRPFTNWHGYFMYATIVLGFWDMYNTIHSVPSHVYLVTQTTATLSLVCGVASVVHWLRLDSAASRSPGTS